MEQQGVALNKTEMQIYDISVNLSATTPTYPGDPGIEISDWMTLAKGDAANVSFLHFGAHSGTHVDAPAHVIAGGAPFRSLPLQSMVGLAAVIEVPADLKVINEEFVTSIELNKCERVLFKTRNSAFWGATEQGFRSDYTYIDQPAAKRLVEANVRLVGIDYLSIERFESSTFDTHLTLLSSGVVILEGLDLRAVPAGNYELICLPLKLAGGNGDGAPARAILRRFVSDE
jgi:arylformamidase